jgi:lipopolysaccharide transport system ATP-binding protein
LTPAIVFDGVSKKFRRGERHDSLRDLVPSLVRRAFGSQPADVLGAQEFWALRDVSFEVQPGEALGIIGANGAGKSTTLKLLTKILKPTKGRCGVRGRTGALIEVAAGFHPDLTGRENVYLQAAIMGMTRADTSKRFDDIVAFAGVGEFIDTQLKRYSSGMNARLGFAVAAHLEPEVLIIDEVLSVGDAMFQARCLERIRQLKAGGVALAFVSHNLPAVESLCHKVLWLHKGEAKYSGDPRKAIDLYLSTPSEDARQVSPASVQRSGQEVVAIDSVELLMDGHHAAGTIRSGSAVSLRLRTTCHRDVSDVVVGFALHAMDRHTIYGENNTVHSAPMTMTAGESYEFLVDFHALSLPEGQYYFRVAASCSLTWQMYHELDRAVVFDVVMPQEGNRAGSLRLATAWHVGKTERVASEVTTT